MPPASRRGGQGSHWQELPMNGNEKLGVAACPPGLPAARKCAANELMLPPMLLPPAAAVGELDCHVTMLFPARGGVFAGVLDVQII